LWLFFGDEDAQRKDLRRLSLWLSAGQLIGECTPFFQQINQFCAPEIKAVEQCHEQDQLCASLACLIRTNRLLRAQRLPKLHFGNVRINDVWAFAHFGSYASHETNDVRGCPGWGENAAGSYREGCIEQRANVVCCARADKLLKMPLRVGCLGA
jgi:hypothetical protein